LHCLSKNEMRVTKESIVRGKGLMKLVCECVDDLWVIYNLIAVGDRVFASTLRKVAVGSQAAVNERVRLSMEISVEELLFDPDQGEIRVSGIVTTEMEQVKLGSHHTLELGLHQPLSLHKDEWDTQALESIRSAVSGPSKGVELVAVMMEPGSAQICQVSRGLTVVKSKVQSALPRKRSGETQHVQATVKFLDSVLSALIRSFDWEASSVGGGGGELGSTPPILIASPGSLKDAFHAHLREAISKRPLELKALGKAQIICASATSGSKWALSEAMADPTCASLLSDLQATAGVTLMGAWQAMLGKEPARAQYGWSHCCAAVERGAVDLLLVSDRLSRTGGALARSDIARLMDKVQSSKGKVSTLSSMHSSGELLSGMGGIVAVLRYVVHDIEEASLEYPSAPGVRKGGGVLGEEPFVSHSSPPPALPGHKIQEKYGSTKGVPGVGAGKRSAVTRDKFGSGWDTESDASVDSDA
jgi:protein pelota